MPTIHFVLADGTRRSIDARDGISLMEAAIVHNIRGIDADCGGCCSCATCHVYIDPAFVETIAPPDAQERELLGFVAAERLPDSRLSCQIVLSDAFDGMVVRLPNSQT